MKKFELQGAVKGSLPVEYNLEVNQLPVVDFTHWMNVGFCGSQIDGLVFQQTKKLKLANGVELSIQAGKHHYCSPSQDTPNGDYNDYDEFEVGFPTEKIDSLMPYAEEPDNPTQTVYSYVPKDLLREIIAAAGGVVGHIEQAEG